MPTRWRGLAEVRRRAGTGSHTVVLADDDQVRAGTTSWVEHELRSGSKVLYTGWLDGDLDRHPMFLDPACPARAALASGQLEFVDFPTVVDRCGGSTEGLAALVADEVRRATEDGWATVALTQESTRRPMGSASEIREFGRQERIYDRLAERWPVNTLCQLALGEEGDDAVRESVARHHRDAVALRWSARTVRGRWFLDGELDVAVVREFAAALRGHVDAARERPTVDLDLRHVGFLDVACARALIAAAGALAAGQRLVLHRAPALVGELVEVLGRPDALVLDRPAAR